MKQKLLLSLLLSGMFSFCAAADTIIPINSLLGQPFTVLNCNFFDRGSCYDTADFTGGDSLTGFVSLWNISSNATTFTLTLTNDLNVDPTLGYFLEFVSSGNIWQGCSSKDLNGTTIQWSLTYCRIIFDQVGEAQSYSAGSQFSIQPEIASVFAPEPSSLLLTVLGFFLLLALFKLRPHFDRGAGVAG